MPKLYCILIKLHHIKHVIFYSAENNDTSHIISKILFVFMHQRSRTLYLCRCVKLCKMNLQLETNKLPAYGMKSFIYC